MMRLSEQQIADGLVHNNRIVRDAVADYFEESERKQSDITEKIIAAVEKYGWREAFSWPHRVGHFEVHAGQIPWVLQQLDRTDSDGPDRSARESLCTMLVHAPVSALQAHVDDVLAHPMLAGEHFRDRRDEKLRKRLSLRELDVATCWKQLIDHCSAVANVTSFSDAKVPDMEMLIERIAEDGKGVEDEVCEILRNTLVRFEDSSCWLVGGMILLAGRLKLERAVPDIFRRFQMDWDWYNEEIPNSLIRIGTSEVLRFVAERYPDEEWYVKNYVYCVFERIHTEDVLDYLLPLIDSLPDDNFRGELGVAAASHYDDRGVSIARTIFGECPVDGERRPIIQRLIAFAELSGADIPEKAEWEAQLLQKRLSLADHAMQLAQLSAKSQAALALDKSKNEEEAHLPEYSSSGTTIFRDEAKVGRNDPCPCGSGKKHKKCCLQRVT